jgi:D-galactarolactone cycloisomerase
MQINSIKSHVLRYELDMELGYSQQYYKHRTVHLVCVETNEGITGWGECFGQGNIALANKFIIENVISPMIVGEKKFGRKFITCFEIADKKECLSRLFQDLILLFGIY